MIFLYTGQLASDPKAGSAVRPVQMLKAFKEIGFDVSEVTGYSAERKQTYTRIRKDIRNGVRYEFCYAETTTMPMALGDPGHLPLRPFLDLRFLKFLKRNDIPVFLFYMDVYWNFPSYGEKLGFFKRHGALLFYKLELRAFYKLLTSLYIPSERMGKYVPGGHEELKRELPPGCIPDFIGSKKIAAGLRLLYVGAVKPPNYNTSDMTECVGGDSRFQLVIACRKEEFRIIEAEKKANPNISVEHRSAKDMKDLYSLTDIVMIFNRPTVYLSFAMPVKLFEAIGYGVPILARTGTAVGEFVAQEQIGWVASGPEEARAILRHLSEYPEELKAARNRVKEVASRHTWLERAREVARDAIEIHTSRKDS